MMLMGWGKFLGLNIEYFLGKGKNPIWRKIVAPGRTRCSGVWAPVLRRRANPTEGPTLILEVFIVKKKFGSLGESLQFWFKRFIIFVIFIFRQFRFLETQPNRGSSSFERSLLFQFSNWRFGWQYLQPLLWGEICEHVILSTVENWKI